MERVWAMRTSRHSLQHRDFILAELGAGRLRQGWGYHPKQDLRLIRAHLSSDGLKALDEDERKAWRHWRMAGNPDDPGAGFEEGDIILVPNMPENGQFALCEVTGQYDYSIDPDWGDFGHLVPVKLRSLGVPNDAAEAGISRSLRCKSRLWWLGGYAKSIQDILDKTPPDGVWQANCESAVARAARVATPLFTAALADLEPKVGAAVEAVAHSAQWEPILQLSLEQVIRVSVDHRGGPSERGSDLDVIIENPFAEGPDWIIVVQVKDWVGTAQDSGQLAQAIQDRAQDGFKVIGAVLACTGAHPSAELSESMRGLQRTEGIPVMFMGPEQCRRLITRGLLRAHLAT